MKPMRAGWRWLGWIFLSFLLACGGGGGGGGGGDAHTPATIDQSSSRSALSIATAMYDSSGDFTDISDGIVSRQASTQEPVPPSLVSTILWMVHQEVFSSSRSDLRTGEQSGSIDCYPGSMTIDLTWDGPDEPVDCTQISNLRGTIRAQNCSEYPLVMNGILGFRFEGPLCQPTAIRMRFTDFSLSDSSDSGGLQMNAFTIDMNDLQWSNGAVIHQTLVFNGDVQGTSLDQNFSAQFSGFSMDMTTGEGGDLSMVLSGALTGGCLEGWVTVATIEPILVTMGAACPTAGRVTLSGTGVMEAGFNADGSVDIGDVHYTTCDEAVQDCL